MGQNSVRFVQFVEARQKTKPAKFFQPNLNFCPSPRSIIATHACSQYKINNPTPETLIISYFPPLLLAAAAAKPRQTEQAQQAEARNRRSHRPPRSPVPSQSASLTPPCPGSRPAAPPKAVVVWNLDCLLWCDSWEHEPSSMIWCCQALLDSEICVGNSPDAYITFGLLIMLKKYVERFINNLVKIQKV